MHQHCEISFDCLPLRSVTRLDIPIDASPKYRAHCERVKHALQTHGSFNSYYLYNARCVFRLTNSDEVGMLEFSFEGTVLTDPDDGQTHSADLTTVLKRETCDWLTEPVVAWFHDTVVRAVTVEFDRYIAAGDLKRTLERIAALQNQSDQAGGYVGMYL